jgi:hypothetical protein
MVWQSNCLDCKVGKCSHCNGTGKNQGALMSGNCGVVVMAVHRVPSIGSDGS